MRKYKQTAVYKDESRIFYVAFFSCVITFVTYMYFVSTSVVDVVMRKEIDHEISALGTTVGQLESKYIEIQHAISNEIATQKGFVSAETKIFIDKTEDTLVVLRD